MSAIIAFAIRSEHHWPAASKTDPFCDARTQVAIGPVQAFKRRGDAPHAPALLHERRHLADRIPTELGLEVNMLARYKPPVVDNALDSAIRGGVQRRDPIAVKFSNLDSPRSCYELDRVIRRDRPQVQQRAVLVKNAPNLPQGSDRALL